jgi:hypothetical protein
LRAFVAAALAAGALVIVQIVVPGRVVYHAGWYNVALSALVVITLVAARRRFRAQRTLRARAAVLAILFGVAVAGLAGVVSGLLAPDNQTVIGAPGQRIRIEALGTLSFPLASAASGALAPVTLERPLRWSTAIGQRPHDAGNFILREIPREVVYVEARDSRGNRLTITQPSGSAFLSPVLLMENRQTIAGISLPFDSFNVPAQRRIVKAVLFDAAQAAMLLHGGAQIGEPAVLFAVDDEDERPLPHAIALSAPGHAVRAGGLLLRALVGSYPAVEVVAAPNFLAAMLGSLFVLGGIAAYYWPATTARTFLRTMLPSDTSMPLGGST